MELFTPPVRLHRIAHPRREILGAFLLICLFRLVGAGACGLWFDEIFTIKMASYPLGRMHEFVGRDPHPPLFYDVVHCLMLLARGLHLHHYAMVWLRLASILPNLAVAAMLSAWVARRWGRRAGLAAMLAVGFSSGMLYYSIELRNYSMAMLFVMLSTLAMIKLLVAPAVRWRLLYLGSTVVYLNLHYLTGMIYVGQFIFLAGYLFASAKRRRPGLWLRELLPHLPIVLMLLLQAHTIHGKYENYYAPCHRQMYDAHFSDLITVFTYDYPAGAVYYHMAYSWYGWLAQAIAIAFYLALGLCIWRARREVSFSEETLLVERLCGWLLVCFLGVTWLASLMNLGKFFAGFRSAMLTLPLWLLLMMATIETRLRPRAKVIFRWLFVALLLPGALYGVHRRSALLDDLAALRDYARQHGLFMNEDAQATLYLDDPQVLPWVSAACPGLKLDSLASLAASPLPPAGPLRLITLTPLDVRLRTPREDRVIKFVRLWSREHRIERKELISVELFEVPPTQAPDFLRRLKAVILRDSSAPQVAAASHPG